MVKNNTIKVIIKIFFVIIFISYASSITFFTHKHIIDGVVVIHSHPYAKDKNGNPLDKPSKTEILNIQTVSVFCVVGLSITATFLIGLFNHSSSNLAIKKYIFKQQQARYEQFRLRPPPFQV